MRSSESLLGPMVYISSLGLFVNDDITLMKWLYAYCGFGGGKVSKKEAKKTQ